MKKFTYWSILFLLILQCACKSNGKDSELSALEEKVMEVHDEVMPEIKYMTKLEKQLKALNVESEIGKNGVATLITNLVEADSLMWDWMHNYKVPKEKTVEETKAYLQGQLDKIQIVSNKMKSSIKEAEAKLNISK